MPRPKAQRPEAPPSNDTAKLTSVFMVIAICLVIYGAFSQKWMVNQIWSVIASSAELKLSLWDIEGTMECSMKAFQVGSFVPGQDSIIPKCTAFVSAFKAIDYGTAQGYACAIEGVTRLLTDSIAPCHVWNMLYMSTFFAQIALSLACVCGLAGIFLSLSLKATNGVKHPVTSNRLRRYTIFVTAVAALLVLLSMGIFGYTVASRATSLLSIRGLTKPVGGHLFGTAFYTVSCSSVIFFLGTVCALWVPMYAEPDQRENEDSDEDISSDEEEALCKRERGGQYAQAAYAQAAYQQQAMMQQQMAQGQNYYGVPH